MKLSVIMPVYNEKNTIFEIIERVKLVKIDKEIIVVDDASTDGTRKVLSRFCNKGIKIFYHEKNLGKGAAIRTALNHVSGDYVIIQDTDLEYDPNEYYKLLEPILDGKADVVYGSRFLGAPHRVLFFWHSVGNKLLTLLVNIIADLNLTDMETCYKLFRAEVIKKINLRSNRFGFEPEVTIKVARLGYRIYEVPISYSGRNYSEGKKICWKDGIAAIFTILRYGIFAKENINLKR